MSKIQSDTEHLILNADGSGKEVRFQNNGTQNVVIDSSGNVGIGTASPVQTLHISSSADILATFQSTDTGARIKITDSTDTGYVNVSSGKISIGQTDGLSGNNLNIDSSGNVGIGTTSPSYPLEVQSGGAGTVFRAGTSFFSIDSTGDASSPSLIFNGDGDTGIWHPASNQLAIATGGTERMRIDNAGRISIGSTSYGSGAGAYISGPGGYFWGVADGDRAAYFDRLTSDGYIVEFRKDGSAVGRIGTLSSLLTIGDDCGVLFNNSNPSITPFNASTNANRDAAIDLGADNVRFRNAYLSGGVYVGGTGSANYLDDYEEGTWTPSFNNGWTTSSTNGQYTKIGNQVYVTAYLSGFTSTGSDSTDPAKVVGLPFTAAAGRAAGTMFGIYFISGNEDKNVVYLDNSGIYFYGVSSGGFIRILNSGISSNTTMYIQATYRV